MPALFLIRKNLPFSKICLLIIPSGDKKAISITNDTSYVELLEKGIVNEIIQFTPISSVKKIKNLRKKVMKFKPDMALILPFSGERLWGRLKKLIFLRAIGVKKNVYGYKMKASMGILRNLYYKKGLLKHQIFGPLDAISEIGINYNADTDIVFPIRREKKVIDIVDYLWKQNKLDGTSVISIFPGGTFKHKIWPIERFEILCKKIVKNYRVNIVVIGSDKEKKLGMILSSDFPERIHNFCGKFNFLELAEVFRRCILFIGNDSGPAHLASAVNCPSITIFSSIVFPGIWEPWRYRNLAIRSNVVECQFCFSDYKCPKNTMKCISLIDVDSVFSLASNQIELILNKKKSNNC
jgi:ADP-heptose:LPS heptosyltransferase